jgi:membrane dipeptidase
MKYLVALFLLITGGANAQAIHYKSILVDTHNDCITACIEKKVSLDQDLSGINHSDLKRMKTGGLDYQLFSFLFPCLFYFLPRILFTILRYDFL